MASVVKRILAGKSKVVISDEVRDYSNDPYFVKKAKESKAFLEKHGFPKEILEKR